MAAEPRTVTCLRCQRRLDVSAHPVGTEATCACGYTFTVPAPPLEAGALDCPGCGAPVDVKSRACPYCEAPLATASCSRCFGMNFRGAKHCTHCGEKLERAAHAVGEASVYDCPRCRKKLRAHTASGCLVQSCGTCGGLWIDVDTLERIYAGKEEAASVRRMAFPHEGVKRARAEGLRKVQYIPCPVCGEMMNRQNFGNVSGVIIDVCRKHGTWFDQGEIRHCVEFVLSGGLAKAARNEKERLKEEVAHLESMARTFPSQRGTVYEGGPSPMLTDDFDLSGNFLADLLGTLFRLFG